MAAHGLIFLPSRITEMSFSLHSGCHHRVSCWMASKWRRRMHIRADGALRFLPGGKRRFVAERDKMSLSVRTVYRGETGVPLAEKNSRNFFLLSAGCGVRASTRLAANTSYSLPSSDFGSTTLPEAVALFTPT